MSFLSYTAYSYDHSSWNEKYHAQSPSANITQRRKSQEMRANNLFSPKRSHKCNLKQGRLYTGHKKRATTPLGEIANKPLGMWLDGGVFVARLITPIKVWGSMCRKEKTSFRFANICVKFSDQLEVLKVCSSFYRFVLEKLWLFCIPFVHFPD